MKTDKQAVEWPGVRIQDTHARLQQARARLRRVEARRRRYPEDDRLRRLNREAQFRVTELESLLEELCAPSRAPAVRRARSTVPSSPCPQPAAAGP